MTTSNIWAANPYDLGEVDYFHELSSQEHSTTSNFDWRDASIDTNDQGSSYLPPVPVLTLLNNPTSENAKAYLKWQREKIQRIMKAQQVIDQVLIKEHSS